MEQSLFLLLISVELCVPSSPYQHHYVFVNISMSWNGAQNYCRNTYTDLATIDGPMEMRTLIKAADDNCTGLAWIGLEKGNSSKWQWSLADEGCDVNGTNNFTNWCTGEPNGVNENLFCTQMYNNGTWNDAGCYWNSTFVCYDGRYTNSSQYVLVNETMTWTDAQSYCRQNHTDLVTVRNMDENQQIRNLSTGDPWIGLFNDSWQWSDGGESSFRNWRSDSAKSFVNKRECAAVSLDQADNGTWVNTSCTGSHPFFCYSDHVILVQENMTWNDALSYCRNNYCDLVSVSDEDTQRLVASVAKNATTDYVWLGLRFTCVLNFWFWVSAEPVCYQNWAPDNRTITGHCGNTGALQPGGKWVSLPETEKLNFICTRAQNYTYSTR